MKRSYSTGKRLQKCFRTLEAPAENQPETPSDLNQCKEDTHARGDFDRFLETLGESVFVERTAEAPYDLTLTLFGVELSSLDRSDDLISSVR